MNWNHNYLFHFDRTWYGFYNKQSAPCVCNNSSTEIVVPQRMSIRADVFPYRSTSLTLLIVNIFGAE